MIVERYTETLDWSHKPPPNFRPGLGKPPGLWVSVPGEDDWPAWCKAEGFGAPMNWRHVFELDTSRVLMVETLDALDALHRELVADRFDQLLHLFDVDWTRYMADYAGVVIAPYQWYRRCDYLWYNTWDCASGVLWDPSPLTWLAAAQGPL